MVTYLLKFSACLLVFWLVYVLFLEKQNMHRFKRFYLLGALALALVIPALTITEYVEPIVTNIETAPMFIPIEPSFIETPIEEPPFFNLENTLWLIYGLGVALFLFRFVINLIKMNRRISKNENITKRSFIYVLLHKNLIPHSFFNYIFFNKARYESNNIPKEVVLHEETHAKQLHSLDIIVLELFQTVLWFHPLIYILKHHIKLNHEFLADQAVLKQGSDTKTYQNILLQFSSGTQNQQLASAINYSSIKKRFTVMKTQTSKTRIWLSTVLVLPIIAILFYSFAEKEYVEKESIITSEKLEIQHKTENKSTTETRTKDPIMLILINRKNQLLVDDELGTLESIESKLKKLAKQGKSGQLVSIKYDKETSKEIISKIEELIKANKFKVASFNISPIMSILINRKDQLLVNDEQSTLRSIENKLKKLVKQGESGRLVFIKHDEETSKDIISKIENLVTANTFKVAFFDMSKIPPPPPPLPAPKKTKGGPNHEDTQDIYNPSFLEYIIEMEKEGATFYLDGKKITSNKAESIAKNNKGKKTEMLTQKDADGNYIVKLSSATKNNRYARSIDVKILNDNTYSIDGIKATKRTFSDVFNQLHQDITPEIRNNIMNIHVTSSKAVSDKETWFIYNALQYYGFYRIVTPNQDINRAKGNTPFAIKSSFSKQEKATEKQVAEYNAWAKKINAAIKKANANKSYEYPIIKQKAIERYINIYKNLMTDEQRKNAEPLPKIPPPPPPTKAPQYKNGNKKTLDEIIKETPKSVESGYELLENGESHYYTVSKGKKTYYNKDGYITDKKGSILPPPPPAPESTLDFVIRMAKANAKFFYKLKPISYDKAIEILKKKPKTHINAQNTDTKQPLVYISDKPIHIGAKGKVGEPLNKTQERILPMVNGKTIKSGLLTMTRSEIKKLKLTLPNSKITSFKLKIRGIKTEQVKGNTITKTTLENLNSVKTGEYITLFDIKDDEDSKFSPVVIEIID